MPLSHHAPAYPTLSRSIHRYLPIYLGRSGGKPFRDDRQDSGGISEAASAFEEAEDAARNHCNAHIPRDRKRGMLMLDNGHSHGNAAGPLVRCRCFCQLSDILQPGGGSDDKLVDEAKERTASCHIVHTGFVYVKTGRHPVNQQRGRCGLESHVLGHRQGGHQGTGTARSP